MRKREKRGNIVQSERKGLRYVRFHPWLYLMMLPTIIYFIVFHYVPLYGIQIAFRDFSFRRGIWGSEWVGLEYFRTIFSGQDFPRILRNSFLISFYKLAWGFPVPILLALMLNEIRGIRFKRTVQTIIYLPYFISWVILSGLITNYLSSTGIVNSLLTMLGSKPVYFLQEKAYFRTILVASEIWKGCGWGTIIYLATLSNIDPQLYEAARVDGASRLQCIRYISLPGLAGTIAILLVLNTGSLLSNGFEQIFLLQNDLVRPISEVFETYTYRVGLIDGRFGISQAVGLFKALVSMVLIFLSNRAARRMGYRGLY